MTILFFSPNPIWGGAATANMAVAKMLINSGYNVVYNDEYLKSNEYDGVPVDHYPVHANRFKSRKLFYEYIHKIKPNAIIWISLLSVYYQLDLKKMQMMGIRQLSIIHSLGLSQNWKGKLMDILSALSISKMDDIIFVSEFTRNSWSCFKSIKRGKARRHVIYNIVTSTKPHIPIPNRKYRIGFVGRFSDEKQPELYCSLSSSNKYDFYAFGEGSLLDALHKKYPEVHYMGLVSDLEKIYSNIDILVMTSKFENCPMVVLESKARGIPCVVPRVGGIPEIVKDGEDGFLYDNYDSVEIMNYIDSVVNSYNNMSNKCIENSRKYLSETISNDWISILENHNNKII